jgi:hypothetical protein
MGLMAAYYRRWFAVAFKGVFERASLVAFILLSALDASKHFLPKIGQVTNTWTWELPFWAVGAVSVVRLIAAPFIMWKEDQQRLADLEDEEKRKARLGEARLQVSRLLTQTEKMKSQALNDELMSDEVFDAWFANCVDVLRRVCGEDAVASFQSDANTPSVVISKPGLSEAQQNLWCYFNRRAARLDKILGALPTP